MAARPPVPADPPLGAALVPGGATFRIWAPRASAVYVSGDFNGWAQDASCQLNPLGGGHWTGFLPGLAQGDPYLFYLDGPGSSGYKRDPRARLLTVEPPYPQANCVLRDPAAFPWHETGFRPPAFNDLVIYQLHVGTYSIAAANSDGRFLDIALRAPYLAALGVEAVEPLPVQEFKTEFSLGYNGTDYFSPETQYGEAAPAELAWYFDQVNATLAQAGQPGYATIDVLRGSDNQLRAMVDVCHVHGIAVLLDVVYNHAGGDFDDNCIYFLDRMPRGDNDDSLYFTDQGWAGGLVFAYWNQDVRQFLVDNARFLYEEYRIDGLRFDEVSVMDRFGGWQTCQQLTGTLRAARPEAIQIAEYWPVNDWVVKDTAEGGAGFDAAWGDGLRNAVRAALAAAAVGGSGQVGMAAIGAALESSGLGPRWRTVQSIENHDLVYVGREPRIPRLADGADSRSWYARSRSRVATALLLAAPGIPMLFMGQEFLEDKPWNDDPVAANLIGWAGLLGGDKVMGDFQRFTREAIALRRRQPALRGEGLRVIHADDSNRVLAFQRWVEGEGLDVVVVASLAETTWYAYQVGFPSPGRWLEVFNSDVYDNWMNPIVAGNGGAVNASGPPLHGLQQSATLTIPANGVVVFARGGS